MKPPRLLTEVETFLYNNAQNMANKRAFLLLIKTWEDAYLARIEELENQAVQPAEKTKMEDEGGPSTKPTDVYDDYFNEVAGTRYDDYQD